MFPNRNDTFNMDIWIHFNPNDYLNVKHTFLNCLVMSITVFESKIYLAFIVKTKDWIFKGIFSQVYCQKILT